MGVEEEPAEEHLRRSGSLGERIQGGDDEKEVVPKKPPEADDESEIEKMARQVPPEITEGMLGG